MTNHWFSLTPEEFFYRYGRRAEVEILSGAYARAVEASAPFVCRSLIDIGCGDASVTARVAQLVGVEQKGILGIDVNTALLERAADTLPAAHFIDLGCRKRRDSTADLLDRALRAAADQSPVAIVLWNVLHHFTLRDLRRWTFAIRDIVTRGRHVAVFASAWSATAREGEMLRSELLPVGIDQRVCWNATGRLRDITDAIGEVAPIVKSFSLQLSALDVREHYGDVPAVPRTVMVYRTF